MGTDWIAYEAEQRGMEKGMEKGMEEGMEKGMEKGMGIGAKKERESNITTAIMNMRKANKSDDAIVHSLHTLFEYSEAEIRDCLDKIKE